MLTLKGKDIYLRALEPEDLDFLYIIENDELIWKISDSQTPYSRYLIKQYLENAHQDIYEAKQLRLVICTKGHETIGFIDLFDFNPTHRRAGVGILITNDKKKQKGYGSEALDLVSKYAKTHLHIHQLFANVATDNVKSIRLFENHGFQKIGVKKDWNLINGIYKDELLYQKIYVH